MTVALVTVAWGAKYRAFLPRWAEAVRNLETKPDHVAIVTDEIGDCVQLNFGTRLFVRRATKDFQHHAQFLVNQAIEMTDADWVCKMDVDDVILPHALNPLSECAHDVFMFGIRVNVDNAAHYELPARHVSRADIISTPDNLVFSGSPYRRWVWEHVKYRDMIYEDWAFWLEAAKAGAQFAPSPTIDYEYTLHGGNVSLHADDAHWRQVVRELY